MDEVYPISEDTLLILKHLKCGDKVLEVGTGNGEIALYCAEKGSEVTAVDIDPEAIEYVKKRSKGRKINLTLLRSDLFEKVKDKYDTIIFNPPYLPGNPKNIKDLQWAGGGEYGDLIIIKFLNQAREYLKENGEIYLIMSSFNRIEYIKNFPYKFYLLDKLKLSFHEIYLYRIRKN